MKVLSSSVNRLQNLRQIGPGVPELWWDKQTEKATLIYPVRWRLLNINILPRFVGQGVQVFKPGMTFETQVSVKHSDQVTPNFKIMNSW